MVPNCDVQPSNGHIYSNDLLSVHNSGYFIVAWVCWGLWFIVRGTKFSLLLIFYLSSTILLTKTLIDWTRLNWSQTDTFCLCHLFLTTANFLILINCVLDPCSINFSKWKYRSICSLPPTHKAIKVTYKFGQSNVIQPVVKNASKSNFLFLCKDELLCIM